MAFEYLFYQKYPKISFRLKLKNQGLISVDFHTWVVGSFVIQR